MITPGPLPSTRISVPGQCCAIVPIADLHVGSSHCSRSRVEEIVRHVGELDAAAILLGDLVEAIYVDDKRFDHTAVRAGADLADLIPQQFADAIDLLEPLKGRIVGAMVGNHEDKWMRRTGTESLYRHLCKRLDCEPLHYSTMFAVRVWFDDPHGRRRKRHPDSPDRVVRIIAHHGAGSGRTAGAKINRVLDLGRNAVAPDVVLMGHVHSLGSWWSAQLDMTEDERDLVDHPVGHVLCGTTARTYTQGKAGYGERALYPATPLGHAVVRIYPRRIGLETIA